MVVLIDNNDNPIGEMEKQEAHEKGLLHRAFSVFIFNSKGELLLQRRAGHKYHSGGLWTNTCCSHPAPEEDITSAARSRLKMEMGIDAPLRFIRKFTYKAPFSNGLTEYETDYIYVGYTNQLPSVNPDEVSEYKYLTPEQIRQDIKLHPERYTAWLTIIMENFIEEIITPELNKCI